MDRGQYKLYKQGELIIKGSPSQILDEIRKYVAPVVENGELKLRFKSELEQMAIEFPDKEGPSGMLAREFFIRYSRR